MKRKTKIKSVVYHRNGVGGDPFRIVNFESEDEDCKGRDMLAIVFELPYRVAVFDFDLLKQGEFRFIHNSWRGDVFGHELEKALPKDE